MKFNIHGDKILVTDAIKNYVNEKLGKLNKYFDKSNKTTARVVLKVRGRNQIIEVTIPTETFTLRNEESNLDLYAAIDLVIDKLERQLVRNKTKIKDKLLKIKKPDLNYEAIADENEEEERIIVRRKQLDMKPMSEEEALLQMNMLGHDFFIFKSADANNIKVLYRRKDGNYGIIETK